MRGGIRAEFEYNFLNLYLTDINQHIIREINIIEQLRECRIARHAAMLRWVLCGRRLGLPNEIICMISRRVQSIDEMSWTDAVHKVKMDDKQKVVAARRALMAHKPVHKSKAEVRHMQQKKVYRRK